jgi:rod shape determining protein RodA
MSGSRLPVSFSALRAVERFPATLLGICLALLATSLVVLHSASLTPDGRLLPYVSRQMIWASAGLVVFLVTAFLPYPRVVRRCWIGYALGLLALLAVFVVGTKVNGSRRWFAVGPVRIQPSEFMKYLLVLSLAYTVARRGAGVGRWSGLLEAGVVAGIPFLLVMLQPDLGTALTYVPIAGAMVIAGGARLRHLLCMGAGALAAAPLAWAFVLQDYQKLRVLAFLNAGDHAQGGAYQTHQSVIAIGSGGLWGRGYQEGTQGVLGFLPERHTDFIFAVVCEDFGLVGGVLLLGLYGYLLATLGKIARETRDMEGRLLAVGVMTITLVQVVVNVGMTLGVMPVTGLTLPLISYGGSSLVASMFGFGLVASVARNRARVFTPGR